MTPDIAIIGMACRFPGAGGIDEFWRNLHGGVESITFFSAEELRAAGVGPDLLDSPDYVRAAPVLDDPSLFDAEFFGFPPSEAALIDPQHRLFLECAWTALEHAGYTPGGLDQPVGVYAGAALNTYLLYCGLAPRLLDDYVLTLSSNDKDFLATRVSYKLDLTGPSITVQTACSTSLVAVHLAAQSLLCGECGMALAGGVSVRVPHRAGYLRGEGGILSPDGHCRPFDVRGAGTVFGSGAGVVVLKRLADAVADRDTIHAVLKGSAVNNDGAVKVSYAAPSVARQAAAAAEALGAAGVDPATISYLEAHGTGTRLGDPIEVAALTRAYGASLDRPGRCAIGSVKSNVGHLDAAAGVAGLIKTVLALRHRQLPATLHYREPNPEIDFAGSPFRVCDRLVPWPGDGRPRRAAVNALGVGGTNAHVVVEQAPEPAPAAPSRPWQLLPISARSPAALDVATRNLADHLAGDRTDSLADIAFTLQSGRRSWAHRRVAFRDDAGLRVLATRQAAHDDLDVVFLFPGQGAQRAGIGANLYESEPGFRATVDRCAALFEPLLSADLRDVLWSDGDRLGRTEFTQPALFTMEYALAALWSSWGVRPVALLGHSIGELVAACVAGVLSLPDAVSVVAQRGRLTQLLPAGAMLAVGLPEAALLSMMDGSVDLAAVNGPTQCVVAGARAAIAELADDLRRRGIASHELRTSHAFHSRMVEPAVEPFAAHLRTVALRAPRIPFISNLTGTWITTGEATDPAYWARQLRAPVRLADGFETLARHGEQVLLEVGPGATLCALAQRRYAVPSLPDDGGEATEQAAVLAALGRLWVAGVPVRWPESAAGHRRVPLPTYPFERRRFWIHPDDAARPPVRHELLPAPPAQRRARLPVEAAVIGVWRAVLGDLAIEVHDNFYDLGGHSIMVPDVMRRLGAIFQLDLPVLTLVESPTVAELAQRIEAAFRTQGEYDERPSLVESGDR